MLTNKQKKGLPTKNDQTKIHKGQIFFCRNENFILYLKTT